MKFLCVKCDQPMKLKEVSGPDQDGSLAVVYNCLVCEHQIAMLTNAFETQLVSSLGVKIGPDGSKSTQGKCPFTAVVREAVGGAAVDKPTSAAPVSNDDFAWTERAQARLANIPEFVRPMARIGIEKYAREKGYQRVDEKVLDEARDMFGS